VKLGLDVITAILGVIVTPLLDVIPFTDTLIHTESINGHSIGV
jgi:hypothetical protein